MAGFRIRCPACREQLIVPAAGQEVDDTAYRSAERYVLVCACRYRMLVKAGAAGHVLHCPICQTIIKVPSLEVLRRGTTRVLVVKRSAEDRLKTEHLLLLVDDEEGPGADVK